MLHKKDIEKLCTDLIEQGYGKIILNEEFGLLVNDIFETATSFFSMTIDEKMQFACPEILEGYRKMGIEYSETPERPDLNDSFSVWKKNQGNLLLLKWSSASPLHTKMTAVLVPFTNIGEVIFETLRHKISPTAYPIKVSDWSYLQINSYKPQNHIRDFLQDEHEDGHLLTIVKQNNAGLEIKINGAFETVSLTENEFLVMPGSILTLITGGIIQPLYHRVRNNRQIVERKSLMFFINPSLDDVQEPWVQNEINAGIDIRQVAIENSAKFGLSKIAIN